MSRVQKYPRSGTSSLRLKARPNTNKMFKCRATMRVCVSAIDVFRSAFSLHGSLRSSTSPAVVCIRD
jgi:hypothetical protein